VRIVCNSFASSSKRVSRKAQDSQGIVNDETGIALTVVILTRRSWRVTGALDQVQVMSAAQS